MHKKSPIHECIGLKTLKMNSVRKRRLPTLPLGIAVPSALAGLTSLFGMVRGVPRRHGHLKIESPVYSPGIQFSLLTATAYRRLRLRRNFVDINNGTVS